MQYDLIGRFFIVLSCMVVIFFWLPNIDSIFGIIVLGLLLLTIAHALGVFDNFWWG